VINQSDWRLAFYHVPRLFIIGALFVCIKVSSGHSHQSIIGILNRSITNRFAVIDCLNNLDIRC